MGHAVTDGFSKNELYRIWVGCFFDITDFGHCAISVCLLVSRGKTNSNFWCWVYYSDFAVEAQSGGRVAAWIYSQKVLENSMFFAGQRTIAKEDQRAYTPSPHLPPLTN